MKKILLPMRTAAVIVIISILTTIAPLSSRAAYTPPVSTMKIGLYYNTTALPSGNLQNVNGFGSGFEFGYYDSNREFVPIGVSTGETAITMAIDRNISWHPGAGGGAGEYREGTGGSVVVGCFHIRTAVYETFEQAKADAEQYQDSFIKYESGQFCVMIGQYTTRAEAESDMSARGLTEGYVDSGTTNTIAVVKTGTNQMIFEFDYEGTRHLAVRPRQVHDEKPETWFKGYRYRGGFQYIRQAAAQLTVINYVAIEDYIKGILPHEMNNAWPIEALKAQACCARTYALASLGSHSAHGFDLCTTDHCQVYGGREQANERTDRAVEETAGMYITYNGTLCKTFYASSDGGASESSENVWHDALPYLRGVVDPYEADVAAKIPNYNWTVTYTPEQITQRLRSRGHNCATIVKMAVTAYTPTGNALTVTLTDVNGTKFTFSKRDQILPALGVITQRFKIGNSAYEPGAIFVNDPAQIVAADSQFYAMNSSGVAVAVPPDGQMYAITGAGSVELVTGDTNPGAVDDNGMVNGVFVIRGTGRGHLVGMSQWGAYSMAEYHRKSYIEIIKFYYTGVEVG